MKRVLAVLLSLLIATPALAAADDYAPRWLAAHNQERAQLSMAPLRWSARLAAEAKSWADLLARRGTFEHAAERDGAGENLWWGTSGFFAADDMIGAFLAEKRNFRAGRFPDVSRDGNWAAVGHYSQIIWPGTREVGCALAQGNGRDVLVCRYWPAGNVMGQQVP